MNLKKLVYFFFILFLFEGQIFADIVQFDSLPEAVSSESAEKEYSFNGTKTIDVDLGELKGVLLTINGTQNVDSVINSTGTYGITLSTTSTSAQHLVVNNVSGFNNFKSAIVNNKSVSTITINNSEFNNNEHSLKGSAIYNLGYLEVNNSTFSLNSSSYGGAVINGDGAVNNIKKYSNAHLDNVLFENNSAQTGGAVFNDVNSTMYMDNVFFSTNTVTGRDDKYGGGAISNKGTITITDNSSFIDNESNISGGAIENSKTLNIYGFAEFIGNHAIQTGGAILNSDYNNISTYSNSVNISSGAIFKDNSAKDGGAIDNDGDFFLTANTNDITFINNMASNFGGAIYNRIYSTVDLKTTDTNTISFINNTATERGGAIYAYTGSTTKIGDGVKFSSNSAKIGGAISTITDAFFTRRPTITIGNNVEFSSNTATKSDTVTGSAGGGAIHAYGSDITIGNNAKFFSNETVIDGGGAIRNGNSGSIVNIGNNAQFISNSAKEGGALYNINSGSMYIGNDMFLSSNTANNGGAVMNVSAYSYLGENAVFYLNTAAQNGGAIHNDTRFTYSQNGHPAEVTINKNAEFHSNTANLKGGAIYNYTYYDSLQLDKKATITIQDGAKFINNSSNDNGGAIYNESAILNLIANTVNVEFTGNTANGVSNAIHTSSGIINLWASKNADIIFNDRITSKNNTSVLNINSSTTTLIANGKITLNEDMSGYTGTVNLYNGNLVLEEGNSFFNTDNFTIHGGTFTANANNILKGFTNNGTVSFTGGTNNNWISGTGRTIIDGEVINSSTIANTVTINAQKKLTTKVDEVTGDIENNGELEFNNNGENSNWISGTGTTIIDGEVINSSTIVNAVTINAQKKLTTNASDLTGEILNNGILDFIGGVNNNTISGTNGILTISNDLENNFAIEQSSITMNGVVTNNSNMSAENIYLNGTFNVGANGSFFTATNSTIYDGSEINLQNDLIQEHNFGNLTINSGTINLLLDADLETETMDTISASDNSSVNGEINIKAINILTDTKKIKTEVLFTNSEILKDKIVSTTTASSKLYKYEVTYNNGYFKFINISNKINPVIIESAIASSVGGFATQINVLGQAFSSIDTQISNKNQAKKKSVLYASMANQIFETENKIERGLWIRPYAVQETVKFNDIDVDNIAIGTLAGLDLAAGENTLLSFYLGYAGSNQKYEDIKVNQTGYIVGATGMVIKEKWYAGLTANVNFNKAESQSNYGTDNFDMNMYSVGAKAGYNFDLSDKWILEPNLMLMYGNVNSQEYETTQGAKIDSQSTANIIVEPQVKAKLSLDNGWQPYGLLGYVANISDKGKVVADEIEIETDKINGYVEYGAGVNKDFINTPWSCYLQVTGRSGGRNGFSGNLGIKYKF